MIIICYFSKYDIMNPVNRSSMTKFNSINFKNKKFMATNRKEFLVSGMSLGIYSLLRPGSRSSRDTRIPVEEFEKVTQHHGYAWEDFRQTCW